MNCEHKNAYTNPTTNVLRCPDCNSILRNDGIWMKVSYHIGTKTENGARLRTLEKCFEVD